MVEFSRLRLVMAVLLVLAAREVQGTTFIPVATDDLARSSVASLIGTVKQLTAVESRDGRLFTLVEIAVEQVLHGEIAAPVITLKENGGQVGGRREVIFGTPTFRADERVLLFLTVRPDGSLRTNHLALGKFRLDLDSAGMPVARPNLGSAALLLAPGAPQPATTFALSSLLNSIARNRQAATQPYPEFRLAPPEADDPSLQREVTAAYNLLGPTRFFEPDEGQPLQFLIDQTGDLTLGLEASRAAVDDALATWSGVGSASIALEDGGLTGDLTEEANCGGPHKVIFNDPEEDIPDPVSCSGTLAVGGFCELTPGDTKSFGQTVFTRAVRGRVTFADGFGACGDWTPCNFAEVATHELGHAIGLDHSSEDPNETDPELLDASMYFLARFDGRCSGLRDDDLAGLGFIYPTAIPPTITTSDPLPDGVTNVPYSQQLTAVGGAGGYSWSLASGGGFPGLDLSSSGIISGTPQAYGASFFRVKATDSNGDSHTKLLNITVRLTAESPTATRSPTLTSTPTPTSTATATTTLDTPTPGITQTPNTTPGGVLCLGDYDDSKKVTVDELVTGVNIALGSLPLSRCQPFDSNGSNTVTVEELVKGVNNALGGCPVE